MNPTQERWLSVPGYESKYEVSDLGNVRSVGRWVTRRHSGAYWTDGQTLKPRLGHHGHHYVTLFGKTKKDRKHFGVHQLVLLAFVGPCPAGMECCHWDDVPSNNHLINLRWGTKSDNMQDKVRNGNHHQANKTHCIRGHEFTAENTYVSPSRPNERTCRTCKAMNAKRRKERMKAERRAAA